MRGGEGPHEGPTLAGDVRRRRRVLGCPVRARGGPLATQPMKASGGTPLAPFLARRIEAEWPERDCGPVHESLVPECGRA